MKYDRNEIEVFTHAIYSYGDVFEVRLLDAKKIGEFGSPHTIAGYFDLAHIGELCEALDSIDFASACYVTLNPVNQALLARCAYRLGKPKATTQDADIRCRHWIPLDFDPERPSGISSSEDEHQSALSFANEMRESLKSTFDAEPISLDSGNGAHLLYRIDLPNDAEATALVKGVLDEFARYMHKDGVKCDAVNYNAARIWKLPGTWARKGDDMPDRPHRMARIMNIPAEIKAVTADQLKAIIPEATVYKMETATPQSDGFDGAQWVAEHFPDAVGKAYNGGTKWVLKTCPFNPDHNRGEAVITMAANGQMGFKCHHNSCSGYGWRDLRALMEPGCYDMKDTDTSNVDFGALTGVHEETEAQEEDAIVEADETAKEDDAVKDPMAFPERLYNVPGFVNMLTDEIMRIAPSPNRLLAFTSALALQAFIAGRKVKALTGARTNLYIVSLGRSGIGKDFPRKVNAYLGGLFEQLQGQSQIIDSVASPQGLEDLMVAFPNILWQLDEIYTVIKQIAEDKTGTKEDFVKMLLTLYSSADSTVKTRLKVDRQARMIQFPNVVLNASGTPELFFSNLNDAILGHGLYSRMSIFVTTEGKKFNLTPGSVTDICREIVDIVKAWAALMPEGSGNLDVSAMTVPFAPGVLDEYNRIQRYFADRQDAVGNAMSDAWKQTIFSRGAENALKFALVYACSAVFDGTRKCPSIASATITMDAMEWGRDMAIYEAEAKIAYTEKYYSTSSFDGETKKVYGVIEAYCEEKGAPCPMYYIRRKAKYIDGRTFADILNALEDQRRISFVGTKRNENGGKPGRLYYPSKYALNRNTMELIIR